MDYYGVFQTTCRILRTNVKKVLKKSFICFPGTPSAGVLAEEG